MMIEFFRGAMTMACAVVGLYFLRTWRGGRDRLFLLFGLGFFALAGHYAGLALVHPSEETGHYLYLLRLAAFLLILAGIFEKKRR